VHGPNFTKVGNDITRSLRHYTFVSKFGYHAEFSNKGGIKLSDVQHDSKFHTFWSSCENYRRLDEICWPTVEALPMNEPLKYIWWPSTAWCFW